VLLVSFELDEILGLCDRIVAISKGTVAGVVDANNADERLIGSMMGGMGADEVHGTVNVTQGAVHG
jgi:simple sugar transport system ATP-binding protein